MSRVEPAQDEFAVGFSTPTKSSRIENRAWKPGYFNNWPRASKNASLPCSSFGSVVNTSSNWSKISTWSVASRPPRA